MPDLRAARDRLTHRATGLQDASAPRPGALAHARRSTSLGPVGAGSVLVGRNVRPQDSQRVRVGLNTRAEGLLPSGAVPLARSLARSAAARARAPSTCRAASAYACRTPGHPPG